MAKRTFIFVLASVLHGGAAVAEEAEATCASDDCHADSTGLLQVGKFESLQASCAGKDIRVVTDMGFDDWGAFSILHAAGCTPTRALATKGMMLPSTFASTFAMFLKSWGLSTKVYMGSEDCYESECINASFIEDEWGYRSHVGQVLSEGTAIGPYPNASDVGAGEDFWDCDCIRGKKYTLLVLSPLSDVAIWLSKNHKTRKCLEEVVMMGGFFAKSENGELVDGGKDDSTRDALMYGTVPPPDGTHGNTELNVASDIKAARAVLKMGLPLKIMPLEVVSIDRVGRQSIKGRYTQDKQVTETTEAVKKLCPHSPGSMLEAMACIHSSGGDVATLDMDAIAATWLWTGAKHYKLKVRNVQVQRKDGQTVFCKPSWFKGCCHSATVGWEFDAVGWFEDLKALEE